MLGYPGSGKTTAAEIIANLTGAIQLSSDKIRAELFPKPQFTPHEHEALYKELDGRTQELLLAGKSVVYDANLNRYVHRDEKYKLCEAVGATPLLIWLKAPASLAKERASHESRSHLWPKDETPEAMFTRLVHVFEPPVAGEKYIEIDGTQVSSDLIKQKLNI